MVSAISSASRRRVFALAMSPLILPRIAHAQASFPDRPMRFIISWPPSNLDVLHRSIFEVARRELGQPVVLENRPGARGTLGAQALMQARPDGYTLAHQHLSVIRHPFLTRQPTWDPVTDFTYIIQLCGFVYGTVVRADSPYQTWGDLIAAARARPATLTYATSGVATAQHILMEELLAREGVQMVHVPFRGGPEGVTALLGRQVDCMSDASSWRPNVEAGEFRLLSIWTPERMALFPQSPTLRELGYGVSLTSPYGIVGPKGMDPGIVRMLHDAFRKGLFDDTTQGLIRRWETPVEYLGPADYLSFVRERTVYEREMVARLGLSIDGS
ncbi:Bug family tripartite tricarboxylate transporter substrate binding protein [Muricoccus radiodurans]|uniref:Bug family tripartite tricarboxylate transporter substrate binding protein n=1 Tax=Muricoccus radiodurans TaxID=2231721 RepID=UPI003CF80503